MACLHVRKNHRHKSRGHNGEASAIPQPVDPGPFTVDGFCAFPVTLTFSGKGGEISLPGGRTLFTSPGLTGTFTNATDPSRSVTPNISGTAERDGSGLTVFNGRSVLATPTDSS